jgi:hypothetical protein
MVIKNVYTVPAFTFVAYLLITKNGQQQFQSYVAPNLGLSTDFRYQTGVTPLTDWPWPVSLCFGYLFSVAVLYYWMKERKSFDLYYLRVLHNVFLCFGSFAMVLGMLKELVAVYQKGGWEAMMCDANGIQKTGSLYTWYYIFFLSKFYEFIDTYILIFRKKQITFLHCFHHFITAFLCWLGLYDEIAVQWIVITLNGSVHVFMYYYYLAQTLGGDVWWKKYLTSLQIVQFCLDLVLTSLFFYQELVLGKECSGHSSVLGFSNAVLLSFLLLFMNFYRHTYKSEGRSNIKAE